MSKADFSLILRKWNVLYQIVQTEERKSKQNRRPDLAEIKEKCNRFKRWLKEL